MRPQHHNLHHVLVGCEMYGTVVCTVWLLRWQHRRNLTVETVETKNPKHLGARARGLCLLHCFPA